MRQVKQINYLKENQIQIIIIKKKKNLINKIVNKKKKWVLDKIHSNVMQLVLNDMVEKTVCMTLHVHIFLLW